MSTTPGRRVHLRVGDRLKLAEGDYGQDHDGIWYARPPGQHMGCLKEHEVTEHEDGTITVTPSICIGLNCEDWHGYLERGQWREC